MHPKSTVLFAAILAIVLSRNLSFGENAARSGLTVTSVTGESWLRHLGRTFDETSMGKTGRLGPADQITNDGIAADSFDPPTQQVVLSGQDLYRLNCRGCHGEFGRGAPPEINSVINPVRATSVAAVMARMKSTGLEMDRNEAVKLADQSRALLLERLRHGGQDMPAFSQLSATEVQLLIGYLKELAEVPGAAGTSRQFKVPPTRVGELIAKSTCHVCHSAVGENPSPPQLADGAIPPLSTLTSRTTRLEFVRKVTQGAPIAMGSPVALCRGRMPVFYYLSRQEAADIYLYLQTYQPGDAPAQDEARTEGSVAALSQKPTDMAGNALKISDSAASIAENPTTSDVGENPTSSNADFAVENSIVLPVAVVLVMLVLGGGVVFTIREMRKLAARAESHRKPAQPETSVSAGAPDDVAA